MFGTWRVFAVLLLLINSSAAWAIVTVGPGCQFSSLAQAVNTVLDNERAGDADVFIGVVGGVSYNEVLEMDSTNITSYTVDFLNTTFTHAFVQIYGDYDTCGHEDQISTAQITASNKAGSVMFIHGNNPIEVVLKNLVLRDANNTNGAATGGGINFTGQGTLDTTNVEIFNNTATDGGGLFANGLGAGLTLKLRAGTFIVQNHARGGGGGMSVLGIVDLTQVESLLVQGNIADSDNNNNGNGGGINFTGAQSWTLLNTTVLSNTAAFGGGISITAGTLTLDTNTVVESNTATGDGGGVNVDGRGQLIAAKPQTLVYSNHATNGRGGGINISGARADIGSPGFSGTPVVFMNDALHGGGIAAVAGANPAAVRLFTTDPNQPVTISNNSAQLGGAVYLQEFIPASNGRGADAGLCAYNFNIDDNLAADGSAIYADTNDKSAGSLGAIGQDLIFLNINDSASHPPNGQGGFLCNPQPASDLGAVESCSTSTVCNEISRNTNQDSSGNPTDGATIKLNNPNDDRNIGSAFLIADRLRIQSNSGARLMKGDPADFGNGQQENIEALSNCLITNNHVTLELFELDNEFPSFASCTFADDTIDGDYVFFNTPMNIKSSILVEGTKLLVNPPVTSILISNSLSNGNLLPSGSNPFSVVADPLFVNAASGDYHLQPTSPALDLAPAAIDPLADDLDLDGSPRVMDLLGINDAPPGNPRDAGAYELQQLPPPPPPPPPPPAGCQVADTIFCSGFEVQ